MPAREYVMFDRRPYAMMETLDDPLTIPVAPEPMMKLDPNHSGGGGDEGGGPRPGSFCWLCLISVCIVAAFILLDVILLITRGKTW